MMCNWNDLIAILPEWLRKSLGHYSCDSLQEIRLRINAPPELINGTDSIWLDQQINANDLSYCINAASRYSPWTTDTFSDGYITIKGGHRIGICGDALIKNGKMAGIRRITSLNIRISHDYIDICTNLEMLKGSILILGVPGSGKTTLLRDCMRKIAASKTVSVIDERNELFPEGFIRGKRMDVLSGCSKSEGIDIVLKTMGPEYIAVDEISSEKDCMAMIRAVGCGVSLAATAHSSSWEDFSRRPVYRKIIDYKIFDTVLILKRDKTFIFERKYDAG